MTTGDIENLPGDTASKMPVNKGGNDDAVAVNTTTSSSSSSSPRNHMEGRSNSIVVAIKQQQQDSGSNQSASDSGLGYTNSISSDNSSIVNNPTTGIERTKNNNIINARESKITSGNSIVNDANVVPKNIDLNLNENNNNNNNLAGQADNQIDHNRVIVSPVLSSSSPTSSSTKDDVLTNNKTLCNFRSPGITTGESTGIAKTNPSANGVAISSEGPQGDQTKVKHLPGSSPSSKQSDNGLVLNNTDSLGRRANITHQEQVSKSPTSSSSFSNDPVLKSALKKRPQSGDNLTVRPMKHNRNVSFNQTVIVFCEEYEASSPSDQCDLPLGYQDSNLDEIHEPPTDKYCDVKTTADRNVSSNGDLIQDDLRIFSKIVGENASNLTDEQLFGLLENESLLDGFKLDSGDFSDDEEFPLNQLNSNHSYLCHDAISDPDSDSESSIAIREPILSQTNNQSKLSNQCEPKQHSNVAKEPTLRQPVNDYAQSSRITQQGAKISLINPLKEISTSVSRGSEAIMTQSKCNQSQQRSMPARMKVSTVDSSSIKRQPRTNQSRPDSDVEPKSSSEQNSLRRDTQREGPELTPLAGQDTGNKPMPVTIKQSNIDSITVSKPAMIIARSDTNQNRADPHQQRQQQHVRMTPGLDYSNQLVSTKNSQGYINNPHPDLHQNSQNKRETIPHNHQDAPKATSEQQSQSQSHHIKTGSIINVNLPTPHAGPQQSAQQQNQACHICKALETNCGPKRAGQTTTLPTSKETHVDMLTKDNTNQVQGNIKQLLSNQHQVGQPLQANQYNRQVIPNIGPQPKTNPLAPNASCASCREASNLQHNVGNHQGGPTQSTAAGVMGANQARHVRPVAYQLVYVLDQNGNRIRALQVVGPALRGPSQATLQGRQLFVAPQGYRFPNPVSLGAQQMVGQQTGVAPNTSQAVRAHSVLGAQSSANHQQVLNANAYQQVYSQNNVRPMHSAHADAKSQHQVMMTNNQKLAAIIPVPRQHTVYYVRQPLGEQNIRQSFESIESGSTKSFPDPHEIRRLDGLRGPRPVIGNQNVSSKSNEPPTNQSAGIVAKRPDLRGRDDADDPTFGFSKRPSVKVVATNSAAHGHDQRDQSIQSGQQAVNFDFISDRGQKMSRIDTQAGIIGPVSIGVAAGSQTLDRRHVNRNQQISAKENIPSTSSMSNINNHLLDNVTTTSKANISREQEHRISQNHQTYTLSGLANNSCVITPKVPLEQNYNRSSSRNTVIIGGSQATGQSHQGLNNQQLSSQHDMQNDNNNNSNKTDHRSQQPRVAYTMNI